MVFQSNNERSKSSGDGGPTQRASAMAALTSAFNSTSKPKGTASQPVRGGQGSQRAAAVAALSSVLTAEQIQAGQTEASIRTIRSSGSLESLSSGIAFLKWNWHLLEKKCVIPRKVNFSPINVQ